MMNYVWGAMLTLSFIFALITNRLDELPSGILNGAVNAVETAIRLLGSLALWNGITEIMTKAGIDKLLQRLLSPFMRLIFPKYSKTSAGTAICANITANLLGLGNAATPLGIEAMRRMKSISGSDTADDECVRFVIINSAALTLIPTTVASLRENAGSTAPFSVMLPVWLSGITALISALIVEKLLSKGWK